LKPDLTNPLSLVGVVTLTGYAAPTEQVGSRTNPVSDKRHRYPPEIIARAVWLSVRFLLSLRLVEEMLLEHGVIVSYETIRHWGQKFGPDDARRFRRKLSRPDDIWPLDEVVFIMAGKKHCKKRWLWRAGVKDGHVRDDIVQTRRNTKAPKRLLTRLLRKQGMTPQRLVTDTLGSYGVAKKQVLPKVEHRSHRCLNNRAGTSHVPLRKRERIIQHCLLRPARHGFVPDSWLTTIPRAASRSSTIRRLSGKRLESQTACSMTSAGNRSPRSMDVALVIIALEEPMFVDTSITSSYRLKRP
jgi:putative transposase